MRQNWMYFSVCSEERYICVFFSHLIFHTEEFTFTALSPCSVGLLTVADQFFDILSNMLIVRSFTRLLPTPEIHVCENTGVHFLMTG